MAKKKYKKYLIILLPIIGILLWYNAASMKTEKENRHRIFILKTIRQGIEEYYAKNKEYPESISILDIAYKDIAVDFNQNGVIDYTRDSSGKAWYWLTCRYSGAFRSQNGKYKLSWSGIQYSNDSKHLPLSTGYTPEADENGFYMADFH